MKYSFYQLKEHLYFNLQSTKSLQDVNLPYQQHHQDLHHPNTAMLDIDKMALIA